MCWSNVNLLDQHECMKKHYVLSIPTNQDALIYNYVGSIDLCVFLGDQSFLLPMMVWYDEAVIHYVFQQ